MSDVLKKKPRMTCKKYCPVWNEVDKDCEIYGEHHFTPRTCPHYNIEILEKKMMIERFNKFVEENYDTQNTKNEQQKDLCITSEQLTEQWKKGELPSGEYYIIDDLGLHTTDRYYPSHGFGAELPQSVLGRVPSYEEWQASYNCMLENEVLRLKNAQLKELLKECKEVFDECFSPSAKHGKLYKKIDEALK